MLTLEEAEATLNSDPAVKAATLRFELSPFYSSAALMKVNEIHRRIQKLKIE